MQGTVKRTLPSPVGTASIELLPQSHFNLTIEPFSANMLTALITPAPQCGQR
jgi:hypothetical protein